MCLISNNNKLLSNISPQHGKHFVMSILVCQYASFGIDIKAHTQANLQLNPTHSGRVMDVKNTVHLQPHPEYSDSQLNKKQQHYITLYPEIVPNPTNFIQFSKNRVSVLTQ